MTPLGERMRATGARPLVYWAARWDSMCADLGTDAGDLVGMWAKCRRLLREHEGE